MSYTVNLAFFKAQLVLRIGIPILVMCALEKASSIDEI